VRVILISSDDDLYKLCREILTEFHDLDWHIQKVTAENCPADGDFYIWDTPASIDIPTEIEQRFSKHLFLVPRNDIVRFQENVGSADAAILLKPVTRAGLAPFFGLAATFHWRITAANALRADRDEVLQSLIHANLQLQEYDQDRTNFLARAIHDFRAPLTAMSGYCGLLLSEALGPLADEQKEVLRRMQHSTKRLSRMASAMFELSIGRRVKRQPDLHRGEIRDCVEQALHEIMGSADSKNISVSVDLDDTVSTLFMDSGQIEQVLLNLLDNACKFTPKNGSIEVRSCSFFWERRTMNRPMMPLVDRRQVNSASPNSYRLDIRGSGPPIPREYLDKIFEEYTSYGGAQDRSGGGLGLAICRMIISAHEGRVWAENTERGPQFSFVLPVPREGSQAPDANQLLPQPRNSEAY
jgi:signal transduction histidine kinase